MKAASLLVCTLMMSGIAHAECAYPKAPDSIPNGSTASEQEMVAAVTQFKQYNVDVESYVKCLDEETTEKVKDAGGAAATIMQIKQMQTKKHNAAVEELQAAASKFNDQVRAFKSKKG